jgi:acetyl esterase/lipase
MRRAMLLSLIGVFTASGCQSTAKSDSTPPGVVAKRIVIQDDIAYRSGDSKAWRLDLAMPENFGGDSHPALVIIHGGGWNAGSKRDRAYRSLLTDYALKGYVTISVEYRFVKEAPFPACIEDVKCAVRWLRAHAKEYHVDPNRIGAYGHSAGAHLVMMLALCPPSAGLEGDGGWNEYSSAINAAAGGSTPTTLPARFGDSPKYSPTTYIAADAVPILLMHGVQDTTVPVATADEFVDKLKKAGARDVTYVRVENANHDVVYQQFLDRTMSEMDRFFARTLPGK